MTTDNPLAGSIGTDDEAKEIRGGWAPPGTPIPILPYPQWFVGGPLFGLAVYVAWQALSPSNALIAIIIGAGVGLGLFALAGAVTKAATSHDTPLEYWVRVLMAESRAPRRARHTKRARYRFPRGVVEAAAKSAGWTKSSGVSREGT